MKVFLQPYGRGRRRGFTLLEMLAVMAGLAIVAVMGVTIIAGAFKIHQSTSAAHTRANQHETFVDQFRADVARATSAPTSLDKWTAGPTCLILQTASDSQIVYVEAEGRLERWRWPKGGAYLLHPGPQGTKVSFDRSGPDGKLVTMKLKPPAPPNGKERDPLYISAALGGDVR
jgi:prepilin-type N-terminal cleavage/methylation domain-containing protein